MHIDTLETSAGPIHVQCIGHGSLMLSWNETIIHIDPYSALTDYAALPQADLVLITHAHGDHLDPRALQLVCNPTTTIIASPSCRAQLPQAEIMKNGEHLEILGLGIQAVPAYNQVHVRESGEPFHPKGQGNGYVLTLGNTRFYVAGDTEPIPEMQALPRIDCAFLPMNLPYTMTPEMVATAARSFSPRILYPYHYGETNPEQIVFLLQDTPDIEIRIRDMR